LSYTPKKWHAWRDYSARPCASPLRGGLWPFKIAPDNFVEPVHSRVKTSSFIHDVHGCTNAAKAGAESSASYKRMALA